MFTKNIMGFLKFFKDWKILNKKISDSFEKRDQLIQENKVDVAQLKGAISILLKSQSQKSLKQSQTNFETRLIKKIRRSKKSLVMAEINKLTSNHTTTEIFNIIVNEKGLCSKASFYRYIHGLKSQKLIETETKLRLN